MTTAYITHDDFLLHDMGGQHPECPQRLSAIDDALHAAGLYDHLAHHPAPPAKAGQILLAHSRAHLEFLKANSPHEGLFEIDADTRMNPATLKAAYRAAGAVVLGVDLILKGEVGNAFCAVRPPGHHAEPDRAMGFCFFNNVAVGALYALKQEGVRRVAVLDFDAHHGNGTEKILKDRESVMVCSTFQHPLYPGQAFEQGNARLVNVPLAAWSDPADFRVAVTEHWRPALEHFSPDLILVSAGFDAHARDPLADLRLREEDYLWVTRQIMEIADRHSRGRVVSALEGGYDLPALGSSVTVHIKALMGLA